MIVLRVLSCFLLCTAVLIAPAQKRPPNIIVILADDLGYGDIQPYGQQLIRTPHLNRMAAEGMKFTQFYAGTSVCAPSRNSLLTGQHTGHTAIRGNKEVKPEGQQPLPAADVTVAELLKEEGYTTGCFGKWGLGFIGSSGDPQAQGFDEFFGYNSQRLAHNHYAPSLWHNQALVKLPNMPTQQTVFAGDTIHKKALEFIGTNKDKPFFLYLAYTLPHAGLQAPDDSTFRNYRTRFAEDPVAVRQGWDGTGYQPQANPKSTYAAMVTRLDRYVGEVMQLLKAQGLDRNTLVLFSSDNGPHKEGGHDPQFFNGSGGLRGIKRDVYEGGIRVPLLAWWPGKVKAGSITDFVAAAWDLLPTFCEMTGAKPSAVTDGLSILPTLTGKSGQRQHAYLYWEFHELGGRQALRMGKWKGVKMNATKEGSAIELYDLEKDRSERTDVAAKHPEIVAVMERLLKEAHVENEVFPLLK